MRRVRGGGGVRRVRGGGGVREGDQEALTVMNSEGSLLIMEWRGVTSGWRVLMSFTQSTLVSATVPKNTSCTHTCTVEQHEVTKLQVT